MVLVTVAVVPYPSSRAARPVGTQEQDNAVESRLVVSSTQVRERRGFTPPVEFPAAKTLSRLHGLTKLPILHQGSADPCTSYTDHDCRYLADICLSEPLPRLHRAAIICADSQGTAQANQNG